MLFFFLPGLENIRNLFKTKGTCHPLSTSSTAIRTGALDHRPLSSYLSWRLGPEGQGATLFFSLEASPKLYWAGQGRGLQGADVDLEAEGLSGACAGERM